jgi:flagellar motor switch protein FliN/FliY
MTNQASIASPLTEGATGEERALLEGPLAGPSRRRSMDLLHNVEMIVTIELGRTRMMLRELLALHPGSVIELDRTTSSPVDILVNGTLLARGEVVVIDDDLGVRITEVVGRSDDQSS